MLAVHLLIRRLMNQNRSLLVENVLFQGRSSYYQLGPVQTAL
jgi:hypothetical protein